MLLLGMVESIVQSYFNWLMNVAREEAGRGRGVVCVLRVTSILAIVVTANLDQATTNQV